MPRPIIRRHFLQWSTALAVGSCVAPAFAAGPTSAAGILLQPKAGDLYRVRMEISIDGNVNLPKDPLLSKKQDRQLPIKATSVIDFEERITRGDASHPEAARRYYYTAESDATIGNQTHKSELRKDAKRVIARIVDGPVVLYGEKEILTRDELELLQVPVCSLAIDRLLPDDRVSPGSTWKADPEALTVLMNLDAVVDTTVEGEIVSIDDTSAKMQLKGRIDGTVDGVSTVLDIAGKITFDRHSQCVTWFAVAVREVRNIGLAKPGFEIAATIKFIRQSLNEANAVREESAIDLASPPPTEKLVVAFNSQQGQFGMFMDRQWQTLNSARGLTTMRMVVDDKAIAQCDIRELPRMKPGEQLTLEAFQTEIQKSLGKRFSEFFAAEEGLNSSGLRTIRTVATGMVQDVPVQWVFLHFSDDLGRRVAATFTLESSHVETFGGADAQLANSFQFTSPDAPQQASLPSVIER